MTSFRARNQLTSWWARRWLESLSLLAPRRSGSNDWYSTWRAPNPREDGFTLARTGSVFDATLVGTMARARVVERRYHNAPEANCSITLTAFDDTTWAQLVAALGARSQVEAALLSGELPLQVESLVATARVSLFPRQASELTTSCDGRYCEKPLCQHVAALHYVLGDMLERDPFVLFELRGRPRARLLAELRAHRRGGVAAPSGAGVPLSSLLDVGYDTGRADLPALPAPAAPSGRLVDSLKTPVSWSESSAPALLLGPAIGEAARLATEVLTPVPASRPRRSGVTGPLGQRDEEGMRRAQGLAHDEPALAIVLPALLTVSLGLDARRGAPAGAVLEAFEALQLQGAATPMGSGGRRALAAWHERWTRAQLERPGELILAPGEVQVGARRAMVLWRLDPDRARPVHWWSEAGSVAQRASLRRRAIETIDGLASRDRTMTLVADLEFGGPPTWDFLTALGWDAVLRCTADEPVALPGLPPQPLARLVPPDAELHEAHVVLLPRLDIHARRLVMTRTEGALQGLISDWTGPPGGRLAALSSTGAGVSDALDPLVAPERRLSVTSDQWMPWLTLWLMTHELLALLGEASDETAASGDHMRHGLHLFTSLPAMTDDQAQSWLRAVARRLGTEPARMIWPSRPTTDSAG